MVSRVFRTHPMDTQLSLFRPWFPIRTQNFTHGSQNCTRICTRISAALQPLDLQTGIIRHGSPLICECQPVVRPHPVVLARGGYCIGGVRAHTHRQKDVLLIRCAKIWMIEVCRDAAAIIPCCSSSVVSFNTGRFFIGKSESV